ncbi:MAG: hypothetical protein JWP34_5398 [Massilia sp.]|nr:hypothetical protein [Massilia sp.]
MESMLPVKEGGFSMPFISRSVREADTEMEGAGTAAAVVAVWDTGTDGSVDGDAARLVVVEVGLVVVEEEDCCCATPIILSILSILSLISFIISPMFSPVFSSSSPVLVTST